MEESRMVTRRRLLLSLGVVIPLAVLAGWAVIGSDDDGGADGTGGAREAAIDGTFVGTLSETDAFIAIVASPAARGQDEREVQVYVSDGERLSERFSGQSVLRNTFVATTDDRDAKARGRLTEDSAEGSVELPDGKTVRYSAKPAAGAAGLYDLTVSSKGLSGASAAGIGLTSASTLRAPGTGTLKFADGKRRTFDVTGGSASNPIRLRAGQVRLIVLPDGQMRGAVDRRPASGDDSDIFIRSAE
jgi:hypothetical protein